MPYLAYTRFKGQWSPSVDSVAVFLQHLCHRLTSHHVLDMFEGPVAVVTMLCQPGSHRPLKNCERGRKTYKSVNGT